MSVPGVSLDQMVDRMCSKVGCSREPVSTLTYDYGDSMAVLGPLSLAKTPHSYDLCAIHADRMSVPRGWQVVKHTTSR